MTHAQQILVDPGGELSVPVHVGLGRYYFPLHQFPSSVSVFDFEHTSPLYIPFTFDPPLPTHLSPGFVLTPSQNEKVPGRCGDACAPTRRHHPLPNPASARTHLAPVAQTPRPMTTGRHQLFYFPCQPPSTLFCHIYRRPEIRCFVQRHCTSPWTADLCCFVRRSILLCPRIPASLAYAHRFLIK